MKIILAGFMLAFAPTTLFAADRLTISKLKDLHLTTLLAKEGRAETVIVTPSNGIYDGEVYLLQKRIRGVAEISLPLSSDDAAPEELLQVKNVIVFGNMATNLFVEKLYRQWQVILDLKYPGPGGYVVRTLHNPYGSGHNVIFIGGSDQKGVHEATRLFLNELKPGKTVSVGWLMKIRLSPDLKLPEIGAGLNEWEVYSWRDSYRTSSYLGYKPSTYFGWNPISIAGVLYYMTGRKEYLDTFKEIAMPDPKNIPLPNQIDDSFNNPMTPLVKSYHYRSHLVDRVFDLIEESPLFTDRERLLITNKLLEHQYELDPDHTYSVPNPDRHAMWHLLNIYTGSGYFATYYPDKIWNRRIENVRRAFRTFINNPTWSGDDTLQWVATYIEPIFEFFLMDGSEEFVRSGTARTMMTGLEILMSGEEMDPYNGAISISLLHKASYLLKDGRYIWMARQLGFDFNLFRIGQSYWPTEDLILKPPSDLVGKIRVYPLADFEWKLTADSQVEKSEAFQIFSYRSGLRKEDDYLLFDGFNGFGAHPYQLNTLLKLRMFNGKSVLEGYGNDLFVWRNGLTENHVPRSAALKNHFETEGFAYLQSEVPEISSSRWQREILYRKNRDAIVVDRITAGEKGEYDIRCFWQGGSVFRRVSKPSQTVVFSNGVRLSSSSALIEPVNDKELDEHLTRRLEKGESFSFVNRFNPETSYWTIREIAEGMYKIDGDNPAIITSGPVTHPFISVQADFMAVDPHSIFLASAKELIIQGIVVFRADTPVTLFWNLEEKKVVTQSIHPAVAIFAGAGGRDVAIPPGEHSIENLSWGPRLEILISEALKKINSKENLPTKPIDQREVMKPVWKRSFLSNLVDLQAVDHPSQVSLWAVSAGKERSVVIAIDENGSLIQTIRLDGEITSLHVANSLNQEKNFSFLAGFKNDQVEAYSSDGKEIWRFKAEVDPSFRIGSRYEAPWFTDPGPEYNKTGVYSLLVQDLWGNNQEEIVVGRSSTAEFHNLDGALLGRVPIQWGDVTTLVSLKIGNSGRERRVLAGKFLGGKASPSVISKLRKNLTDDSFSDLPAGIPNMHAFGQRGIFQLIAEDIDNDGAEEVIYSVKGNWNEIRAYDNSGRFLWVKELGPGKGGKFDGAGFFAAGDLHGNGQKEIVFSSENGWIGLLDPKGNPLWQKRFESSVSALALDESTKLIAVGCSNGDVVVLDGQGSTKMRGRANSRVKKIVMKWNNIYLGTEQGTFYKYSINNLMP